MSTSPYSEKTLKLPDGVEIRYTDSGAPNTSDYTTMVVIHGTGFNGYSMVQLHEYAPKHNLRTILCNRRHYHGTTKYSEEELSELKAGSKCIQDKLGLQTAWFLEHFVKNEGITKVTADRRGGGVILMGWSFGNATTLAILADPEVIPRPVYETIEPYLRSLVLYDPPGLAMGYPSTVIEEGYNPLADPSCTTPTEVFENFQKWVSSYFKHPDIGGGLASGLSFEKCTDRKTIDQWTLEEKAKFCEEDGAAHSDIPSFAPPMQATLRAQAHKALFDQEVVSSFFPAVHVFHISAEYTCSYCMWGYMENSRLYAEALERGERIRPIKFKLVLGGNHFLHCDTPELLLEEIIKGSVLE